MIAFDASSSKNWVSAGSTHTWAHTCTGSDLMLIVAGFEQGAATLSSATYNGVSMDSMTVLNLRGANTHTASACALLNPATGANNIVATTSGSINAGWAAASYTGVRQTSFPDCATDSDSGHATSSAQVSLSVTTATANCWAVYIVGDTSGGAVSSGNVTSRVTGGYAPNLYDTNAVIASAGAFTVTVDGTNFIWDSSHLIAFAPKDQPVVAVPASIESDLILYN
jgi:hypothetical protein